MLDSVLFCCNAIAEIRSYPKNDLLKIFNNRIEFGENLLYFYFDNFKELTYEINKTKIKYLGLFNKERYYIKFNVRNRCMGPIEINECYIDVLMNVIKREVNYEVQRENEEIERCRLEKQKNEAAKELSLRIQREKEELDRIEEKKASQRIKIKNNMDKINRYNNNAFDLFLKNPYRILGVACNSENIEILKAQEKIIKLSKLGVVNSYKVAFDFKTIEKPNREISVVQSSIVNTNDRKNKFFWFTKSEYVKAFDTTNLQDIFAKSNFKIPETYDNFLINYFWLLINDPIFSKKDEWLKVFEYINYLINAKQSEQRLIIRERFSQSELNNEDIDDNFLVKKFKSSVFIPINILLDNNTSGEMLINLHRGLEKFKQDIFEGLRIKTCANMLKWLDRVSQKPMELYESVKNVKNCTSYEVNSAIRMAEEYYSYINPYLFKMVEGVQEYGTYSIRLEEKFFMVIQKIAIIIYYSNRQDESLKYYKLIYKYENSDTKKVLRDTFGSTEFPYEKGVSEFHKNDNYMTLLVFAEKGDANAQYALGCAYWSGRDKSIYNCDEARYWISMAADQGHSEAMDVMKKYLGIDQYKMCDIAERFAKGNGVKKNYIKSFYWYSKASQQNNPIAQFSLGVCFYQGDGVKQDYRMAFRFYTKAAEKGNVFAQAKLAYCYYFGKGINKNEFLAKYWWKKAAEAGNEESKEKLIKYFSINVRDINYDVKEYFQDTLEIL